MMGSSQSIVLANFACGLQSLRSHPVPRPRNFKVRLGPPKKEQEGAFPDYMVSEWPQWDEEKFSKVFGKELEPLDLNHLSVLVETMLNIPRATEATSPALPP